MSATKEEKVPLSPTLIFRVYMNMVHVYVVAMAVSVLFDAVVLVAIAMVATALTLCCCDPN